MTDFLILRKSFYLILFLLPFHYSNLYSQQLAFPGAEGWGKFTSGGRGGTILEVSNLNDSGPGSLREAVYHKGARIIVFKVSGTISLDTNLTIQNDSVTIAGQTAPGDGICIKNYPVEVRANEVIIRFLRLRHGDERQNQDDALNIMGSRNVIIDHCSASWGVDETLSAWGNENVTVQWCIVSESLDNSYHFKGPHGYGAIWGGTNCTYHHNLLADHTSRNPRFSGGVTAKCINVDFRNNLVFNWGFNSSYGGEAGTINMVDNYYKPGPATLSDVKNRIVEPWDSTSRWYISGNFVEGFPEINKDNWNGGVQPKTGEPGHYRSITPFKFVPINEDSPVEVYNKILKSCGAILPERDAVDNRIIEQVVISRAASGSKLYAKEYNLDPGMSTGIIDSQTEVNGWPELKSSSPPADSDNDGIPDVVEKKYGLDPHNYRDRNEIAQNGYTYIEEYLNSIGTNDNQNPDVQEKFSPKKSRN